MATRTHLKPQEIADSLGVGVDTVLKWINTDLLPASNIAMTRSRPRWRVKQTNLDKFLDARSNVAKSATKARRHPKKTTRQYV